MGEDLLLSVVIPSHNNLALLQRCIASWRKLRSIRFELIVIEDGCNDGTAEWLQQTADDKWLRWFHEDDVFETLADNRGMSEAQGRYILIWQDDMFLRHPWLIEGALNLLNRTPELGVLGLMRGHIFRPLKYVPSSLAEVYDPVHAHLQIAGKARRAEEVHSCIRPWLVRRECIEAHGLFDPAYAPFNWDEHDLHMRLRSHGWKVGVIPGSRMGGYFHWANSSTSQHRREWFESIVVRNGIFFHQRWDSSLDSTPPCKSSWPINDWRCRLYGRLHQLYVIPFTKHGFPYNFAKDSLRKCFGPAYRVMKRYLRPG